MDAISEYEKLLKIIPDNFKPRLGFNKRVENLHNKLDLIYIDGIYKDKESNKDKKKYYGGARSPCIIVL